MASGATIVLQRTGGFMVDDDGDAEGRSRQRANEAMERFAGGDDDALGALYDELAPKLLRFALCHLRSKADAEDVVQDTVMLMSLSRDRFARGSPVLPWAYAIARNRILDLLRHQGYVDAHAAGGAPEVPEPPADQALELRQRWAAVVEEVRRLPEKFRGPFVLVKLEGLPVVEAAQVLGISKGNVKVRAHRAQQMLVRALRNMDDSAHTRRSVAWAGNPE
jgi:RNA polymerase sigma-70 factor, ECF subfamily